MINAIVFFILPSGCLFKLNTITKEPLHEFVKIYSNRPCLVYGFNEDREYWWFEKDFIPGAAALLLKEVYK